MSVKIYRRNEDGLLSIRSPSVNAHRLTVVQAQNILLTLQCESNALFDTLCAFEDKGHNYTDLGLMGSFIYSEKIDLLNKGVK